MRKLAIPLFVPLVVTGLVTLSGCEPPRQAPVPTAPSERFKLVMTQDGKTLRLNTQNGQVSIVTDKGLSLLPTDERIKLVVGEIYTLENGDIVAYEGNQKFGSATEAFLKNLKKQRNDTKAP